MFGSVWQYPLWNWLYIGWGHNKVLPLFCRTWLKGSMEDNGAPPHLDVCDLTLLLQSLNSKLFYFIVCIYWLLKWTGKKCCNIGLLASWQWMPLLMEQYADNRRLLHLLVSGNWFILLLYSWLALIWPPMMVV